MLGDRIFNTKDTKHAKASFARGQPPSLFPNFWRA